MFYDISMPVMMDREAKDVLGLEVTEEKIGYMMAVGWDGFVLRTVLATPAKKEEPEQVKLLSLSLIRSLLNTKTNDYFDFSTLTITPIEASSFFDLVLEFGHKYPKFDNGENPNHTGLFKMYMHQRFDYQYDLIKHNISSLNTTLKLPLHEIPTDFDFKIPVLLVSSNPMISHLFARELRLLYRKATTFDIKGIRVYTLSPYERLIDFASLFDPDNVFEHRDEVYLIDFSFDGKHPLAVDLFDHYVMPRILDLAKETLVILVSDDPYVLDHYRYTRMLRIDLNAVVDHKHS